MKFLKQLFCKHKYIYKGWHNAYRLSSCMPHKEMVFRCEKCGKYTALFADELFYEQDTYFKMDVPKAPARFFISLPSYGLSGDEGFGVYNDYLKKGIDLMQVQQMEYGIK